MLHSDSAAGPCYLILAAQMQMLPIEEEVQKAVPGGPGGVADSLEQRDHRGGCLSCQLAPVTMYVTTCPPLTTLF